MNQGVPARIPAAARRWPIVSLLLALGAVSIHLLNLAAPLQLDRARLAEGWRVVTCHFTHFGFNHLIWDLAIFAVLSAICEWINRKRLLVALALSIVLIPPAVLMFDPHVQTYRGLSGLDSMLLGLLAMMSLSRAMRDNRRIEALLILGLLVAFLLKLGIEIRYDVTVFVDNVNAGFVPIPMAHAVGLAVGILVACSPQYPPKFEPLSRHA